MRDRRPIVQPSSGAAGGPVRILVSACLLGEAVRYDGGHKRDAYLVDTLAKVVACVPVCPEVGCGLPVPREPMRLDGERACARLVGVETGVDHTERMTRWTREALDAISPLGLRGYLCKKDSPSCGREEGLFTRAFRERFPRVPVEEEGCLADPGLREAFLGRVFGRPAPGDRGPGDGGMR